MTLRHTLEYRAYRIWVALMRRIPLRTSQRIAVRVARWIFNRSGERVGYALVNLRIAYPDLSEEERREIGRQSYIHFAWNLIDHARSEDWSEDDVRARMRINGTENVRAALAEGRGALILVPHLGNFDFAVVAFTQELADLRAAFVARPMRNPLIWRHVIGQRTSTGAELIYQRDAVPQMVRLLREGAVVGILSDQYMRATRVAYVPFFGVRCATTTGAATLALRTGAPVLPAFIMRDAPDHHTLTLGPPLEPPREGDIKDNIEAATAVFNRAYEDMIRQVPEQYMWATRRFRHSPDLPPEPYTRRKSRFS